MDAAYLKMISSFCDKDGVICKPPTANLKEWVTILEDAVKKGTLVAIPLVGAKLSETAVLAWNALFKADKETSPEGNRESVANGSDGGTKDTQEPSEGQGPVITDAVHMAPVLEPSLS